MFIGAYRQIENPKIKELIKELESVFGVVASNKIIEI